MEGTSDTNEHTTRAKHMHIHAPMCTNIPMHTHAHMHTLTKLRNGLSYQLPISNTSCHTTSLYENRLWCAPCRLCKAQYPEGFEIQVAPCRNVQIASKRYARKGVLSLLISADRFFFTSSVMEIQQCKHGATVYRMQPCILHLY